MSANDGVAKAQTIDQEEALPLTVQAAYLPGQSPMTR